MRPVIATFAAHDRDGICAAQQRTGAGALVINGALLDKPATMIDVRRVSYVADGAQRVTSIYSGGNLSGVTFTIAGYLKGQAVTETLSGPNATTVETTQLYDIVTAVSVSGTIASDAEIGNGTTGQSAWIKLDTFKTPFSVDLAAVRTTTIQYDVNYTLDNVDTTASPTEWAVAAAMTNATTSQVAALTSPVTAVRFVVDSTTGGTLVLTVIQAG